MSIHVTNKWRSVLVAGLFILLTPFWVWAAWDGDHFALVALGAVTVILAGFVGFLGWHWCDSLEHWGDSLQGWQSTQDWANIEHKVLLDALEDLSEHDPEAATIHAGRVSNAMVEWAKSLHKEG